MHTLSASGTAPTAVEFVEKDVVRLGEEFIGEKFPPCDAACYLILTFDGSRTGVEEDLKRLKQYCAGLARPVFWFWMKRSLQSVSGKSAGLW